MGDDPQKCLKPCPLQFNPHCATILNSQGKPLACTFPNRCSLDIYICIIGKLPLDEKPQICEDYRLECTKIVASTLSG
ncbi:hypothetical protein FF38_02046 [Lucilia cuprina]|uniref:Kazal-like domain-containing protein n=1 Tax=Lucilia cuprina TaxID=7375 RepID=A0A0L0BW83_LUCCU|nr:hypothetical protein FF38_02046 [Lucilia cuprina]